MKLLTYPARFADSLMDRLFAVVGAVLFSQIPGFISHYMQRLGGHLDEAQKNVAEWRAIAVRVADGSLFRLIDRYLNSGVAESVEAGRKCSADIARFEELQLALDAISKAPVWKRAWVFLRHVDGDIARSALAGYVPNVPIDPESLIYGLAGLVLGVALYQGSKAGCRRALGSVRARRKARRRSDGGKDREGG